MRIDLIDINRWFLRRGGSVGMSHIYVVSALVYLLSRWLHNISKTQLQIRFKSQTFDDY